MAAKVVPKANATSLSPTCFIAPPRSSPVSIPRNSEVTVGGALTPGARDSSVVRGNVVQLALGCDMNGIAGLVLAVRFDANGPVRDVHEDASYGNGIGTRVDDAGDLLAIPVHDERDVIPLSRTGSPVARPRAGQRVSFLNE